MSTHTDLREMLGEEPEEHSTDPIWDCDPACPECGGSASIEVAGYGGHTEYALCPNARQRSP